MPWCEDCAKFWNPNTMPPDGTCPTCGRLIGDPPSSRVPWHFWVLIIGTAVYLAYRMYQGFRWLVTNDHIPIAIVLGIVLVAGTAFGIRWWVSKDSDAEPPAAGGGPDIQPNAGGA